MPVLGNIKVAFEFDVFWATKSVSSLQSVSPAARMHLETSGVH